MNRMHKRQGVEDAPDHASQTRENTHTHPWHTYSIAQIEDILETSVGAGLDASSVQRRLAAAGANTLHEHARTPLWKLFLHPFQDFMVVVLLVATALSAWMGETVDALTIVAILIINAILGVFQEYRAEKSLQALKKWLTPTARGWRGGVLQTLSATALVPGDVVVVQRGDRIPADVRWVHCDRCMVEEGSLTGESLAVEKDVLPLQAIDCPLGDRRNMGYMGTMVTQGKGTGIVVATAMETQMGKIAHLLNQTTKVETPLQQKMEQFGKKLITVALVLTGLVIVIGLLQGQPWTTMVLAGISLAVAAIPEGLPAIVTVVLALGVQRMLRHNTIVRKLPSVETLGCATVICADKTGTLTQNNMTVTTWWSGGIEEEEHKKHLPEAEHRGKSQRFPHEHTEQNVCGQRIQGNTAHIAVSSLVQIATWCNEATWEEETRTEGTAKEKAGSPRWRAQGEPTEKALLIWGALRGVQHRTGQQRQALMHTFPFDAVRKRMSVIVATKVGRTTHEAIVYVKGAPERVLERCTHVWWQGRVTLLTDDMRDEILAVQERYAQQALRVLGFAQRKFQAGESCDADAVEQRLTFVGLVGMMDPPRLEVREAIAQCQRAKVRTVMITGDHVTTATAIARQLHMLSPQQQVIDGERLDRCSDEQLDALVDNVAVYARVTPEHKLRVVQALQRRGHVVAMTGDGVNDAPAMKAADIGIAMGKSGTDVTKEAADLVLHDDNFSTIVTAIGQGRNIYANIRKFIRYLLASNVGEIVVMLLAMAFGMPLPLLPIMILWVNLVTDGLPAMALGVDRAERDVMQQAPRGRQESIFAGRLGWKIVSRGIMIGICTIIPFALLLAEDTAHTLSHAQTVAFATLVMAQLIHVFDCRSSRSIFHRNIFGNPWLLLAVASSIALLLIVMYYPPLQTVFQTVSLSLRDWALVLVFAALPTFLFGIGSVWAGAKQAHKQAVQG